MNAPATRICEETGLALTAGPVSALRIATESYGPLDPKVRITGDEPGSWGRYDTLGRTVYASADPIIAYMELLAPYRTEIKDGRRALQTVADALGMPLEQLWHDVVEEWDAAGTMKAKWLPRVFREGRNMYTITFPEGWWIDITATETISVLDELIPGPWPTKDGLLEDSLTLSHITGDDRILTTAIASELRSKITLDDGTLPLGVEFSSKHGHPSASTGVCWAYWMRDVDSGLSERAVETGSAAILEGDAALLAAQRLCKIKTR